MNFEYITTRDVTTLECPHLDHDIKAGTLLAKCQLTDGLELVSSASSEGMTHYRTVGDPSFYALPNDAVRMRGCD